MNWLAHLWLADRSGTSAAGQILGDQIKGRIDPATSSLGDWIATGIVLHRRIDRVADAHDEHAQLRELFAGPNRRYAGIVVDIGLDHALARIWPAVHDEPLARFAARLSAQVADEWPVSREAGRAPEAAQFARLLAGYHQYDGITRALGHVERRLRRPVDLVPLADTVVAHRDRFEQAVPVILDDLLVAVT